MTVVEIASELYGNTLAIATFVGEFSLWVVMSFTPPIGTAVTVHFFGTHGDLYATARVDGHEYQGQQRFVSMRIVDFPEGPPATTELLH